jgi:hypothetical protein
VRAEIVHDDTIAGCQGGNEELLDPCEKGGDVDRTIENQGRVYAVIAERDQKSRRLPVTMWRLANQPLAFWTTTARWLHLGCRPGLVDEDDLLQIECRQTLEPSFASLFNVLALLLRRMQRLFYSSNSSDGDNSRWPSRQNVGYNDQKN